MKSLLAALALTLLGVAIGAVAPLVGDRTTLVPPPDARVEAFLRQLSTRRDALAVKYLARELGQVSATELQERFAAIERQRGATANVMAATISHDRHAARVRGELVASRGARTPLEFGLRWEQVGWVIQDLPDALRPAPEERR
jgi:hypothetical protein